MGRGPFSSKPYLFNADNVARFAPARWHSPGRVIDTSYEALDNVARGGRLPPHRSLAQGVTEPAVRHEPPPEMQAERASAASVVDRAVWLVHPWALCKTPEDLPADVLVVAACPREFHDRWVWSGSRWAFVGARMRELSTLCWHDSGAAIVAALQGARSVRSVDDAHLPRDLRNSDSMDQPRRLFAQVEQPCSSFSRWWKRASVNKTFEFSGQETTDQ